MAELTNKQKDLIVLAEKGANDAHLVLLDKIHELEDKLEAIKIPDLEEVLASVRGKQGKDGVRGPKGEQGERGLSIIGPQGEKGDKGEKGEQGDKGDKGERGQMGPNGLDGINGLNGKDGRDGVDGKDGSMEELAEYLKSLEEKMKETRGRAGGGGLSRMALATAFIDDETPTGDVDGANTDFVLRKVPQASSLKVYVNGARMRVTEDYTLANRTITFLTAPPTGSIILCDYRR